MPDMQLTASGGSRSRHGDDTGQAVMLMLIVVAMTVIVIVAVAVAGARLAHAGRARAAADAAALAGTSGGRDAATRLAAANGGRLLRYSESHRTSDANSGVTVVVEVGVGDETATAAASTEP